MKDTIIAIIVSIIASFIYDSIKKFFHSTPESDSYKKYSKEYFKSVKKEFYISFPLGIVFSIFPRTSSEFINIGIRITSFFMFFISLMAFMCLVEMVNHFTDNNTEDNS